MRPSKRDEILAAAKRVVQREGVTTLTYESVAAEAGLTKGGLLYHFPSREDLLLALHTHVAAEWEQAMEAEAGAPAEEITEDQRFAAYTRLSQNPERAELILQLEASENPEANEVWERVYRAWAPEPPSAEDLSDGAQLQAFIARLAADGLWFYEALSSQPLDPAVREQTIEAIIRLASPAEGAPETPDDGA
ncbi:TetR/AcrR family transcriptional regulator [Nesterenkonia sp.]|uniref:TetR/AcrR family transcriptional regulator n=1 Tax=Nesterenkonia sp. TaxID=704201 RepID=UPI00262969B9|nr:TetR/AcrR family transcriptional regulator [Nesterenkonia sp.]